jgi:hypothetical protein
MPELRVYRSPWGAFPDVIIQTNMTTLQGGQNAWAKPGAQLICGVCYEDSEGEISVMLAEPDHQAAVP